MCTGVAEWTDALVARLDRELDDAAFGAVNGVLFAEVERPAPTASEAIATAIQDLEDGGWPELKVIQVEPDELVTMADIAERQREQRRAGSAGTGSGARVVRRAMLLA